MRLNTTAGFARAICRFPVGDAVIGVYRDRYIYLVGGRTNGGLVTDVQVYDVDKNRWSKATSIGTAVFGHAGALVGDTILYVDGAVRNPAGDAPRFVASDECWSGKISHHDPARIEWTKLPAHPGTARFRIAAGVSEKDEMIYFSGGSDSPHDDAGIGYDGKPAEPSPVTFAFDLRTRKWETLDENTPDATMDHRGLLVTKQNLVIIGGMEKGQTVTAKIVVLSKEAKAKPPAAATYLALASTRVTSSGCLLAPIQSSTAAVTISLMRASGWSRFSRSSSIKRCSPNSPKSFSGSVTPSL